jgi:hypothetical protein
MKVFCMLSALFCLVGSAAFAKTHGDYELHQCPCKNKNPTTSTKPQEKPVIKPQEKPIKEISSKGSL